jgi:hypothetical protein
MKIDLWNFTRIFAFSCLLNVISIDQENTLQSEWTTYNNECCRFAFQHWTARETLKMHVITTNRHQSDLHAVASSTVILLRNPIRIDNHSRWLSTINFLMLTNFDYAPKQQHTKIIINNINKSSTYSLNQSPKHHRIASMKHADNDKSMAQPNTIARILVVHY